MDATKTIQDRVASAAEILKLDPNYLKEILDKLGIEEDQFSLNLLENSVTEGDLHCAIGEVNSRYDRNEATSAPRCRAALAVLQGKDPFAKGDVTVSSSPQTESLSLIPIGQWSNKQLLESYGKDCSSAVEKELKERGKDKPFVIFNDDETVDVDLSAKMLAKSRRQPKMPERMPVNGVLKRLHRVGEFPLEYFYVCPFHPEILLVDGYCEKSGITWDTSNEEHMQLCQMVEKMKDLSDLDKQKIAKLSIEEIKSMFPNVAADFDEKQELGQLKSLKRKISKGSGNGRDPFHVSY